MGLTSSPMATNLTERTRRRIRQVMREKGLSQVKLGRAMGTTQGTVGKYLRGDFRLTVEFVEEVADAMGISPAVLLAEPAYEQPELGEEEG